MPLMWFSEYGQDGNLDKRMNEIQKGEAMKSKVILRDVVEDDLPIFFEHQNDPDASRMAAFTAKDPADQSAFRAHWNRIMGDKQILIKTILHHGVVAGHVLSFEQFGKKAVSYWVAKEYWGKGIATKALAGFLAQVAIRPLYARAAKDNIGSIRVLEKCGFNLTGDDKGYSNARGDEVEEFIFKLEDWKR